LPKLNLDDVANISGAESTALSTINTNSDRIETALENTLSRDGTTPNTMSADFDMNGNDILNIGSLGFSGGDTIQDLADQAAASALAAASSEAEAETAEANAVAAAAIALGLIDITSADTRTALKAIDTTETTTAYLKEEGREGIFLYRTGDFSTLVAADTEEGCYLAADGIATTTGAWVRQHNAVINAKHFGAEPSNTAAENTTALQAWIDMLTHLPGMGFLPNGTYQFDTKLSMLSGSTGIYGEGQGSILQYVGTDLTSDVLEISSGTDISFVTIKDLSIYGVGSATDGANLKINRSTSVKVENIYMTSGHDGIVTDNAHVYDIRHVLITNLQNNGVGVTIQGDGSASASLENYLYRIFIQGDSTRSSAPRHGFLVEDNQALLMEWCTALYCEDGLTVNPDNAQNKVEHIFVTSCLMDLNHNIGANFLTGIGETNRRILINGSWFASSGAAGLVFDGASADGISVIGCQMVANGTQGIWAKTVGDINIIGNLVAGNSGLSASTYAGIEIGTSGGGSGNGIVITGNRCGPAGGFATVQKYGIFLNATATDNVVISSNDCRGNATAGIQNDATGGTIQIFGNLPIGGITDGYYGSATWDPVSIGNNTSTATTVGVTGASIGDPVSVGFTSITAGNIFLNGHVTSNSTVTVSLYNASGGTLDLASGTLKVLVHKTGN